MGISRMHALVEPSQDIPDGVVLTTKHPGDVLFVEQGFSRHTCKNDSQNLIYFCKS